MMVDFSQSDANQKLPLATLKALKQDLIGGDKQAYYDKGLLQIVINQVDPAMNQEMLYECLAILNSFLIETSDASKKFEIRDSEL